MVIPGHASSCEPQMCNCTSGNLEIPGSCFARPGMTKADNFMPTLTRRTFLSTAGAGLASGALAARARAAGPTPDQMLDELIQQNQDSGLGSGFDN